MSAPQLLQNLSSGNCRKYEQYGHSPHCPHFPFFRSGSAGGNRIISFASTVLSFVFRQYLHNASLLIRSFISSPHKTNHYSNNEHNYTLRKHQGKCMLSIIAIIYIPNNVPENCPYDSQNNIYRFHLSPQLLRFLQQPLNLCIFCTTSLIVIVIIKRPSQTGIDFTTHSFGIVIK